MDTTASAVSDAQGTALLAVSVTTVVIALFTCLLRHWVRSRISQTIGWEDYFVGGAMLLGVIGVSFSIVEGASLEDNDAERGAQAALQFDYLARPWLGMGSALAKVSICLLIRRLVARSNNNVRVWRVVLAAQIILLLLVNLAYTFTALLRCRPLEKLWKPDVPGRCWGLGIQQSIGYFQGAFDVFTQLFITLFPIIIIQDLGVPRTVRWPFYLLSITSIIIAMLCVLRTYNISLIELDEGRRFEVITTILVVLEQNLNIIAANILPISSLCSRHVRPISQALNEAASAREIRDTTSMISKRSQKSRAEERRRSDGSSNGGSSTTAGGRPQQRASSESRSSSSSSSSGTPSVREALAVDVWPLGIIKTVSVEVVEEDVADLVQDRRSGDRGVSRQQQNWDSHHP